MKNILLRLIIVLIGTGIFAQADQVSILKTAEGEKLIVNGKEFMINGMNWDYIPIGTNTVNADFWNKPDDIIKAGLDTEMSLLRNMNVNVIRQYTGVPARWVQYIYENYGIYTMLNHSFGRYGLTIDGVWTPITDYSDARTQELLMSEVQQMVEEFKDTPGLLFYLLGNENNYGLFWQGAETEDFPDDEQEKQFIGEKRGRPMYRLMNEASLMMKGLDPSHPVAICNGDVLFIDIIAEECPDVDIYGTNTYRGVSFGDMFQVVKEKLDKPLVFTEFGADAFNAIENKEDQKSQAYYMVGNWKEIYENAAGLGKANNSIGGFTFQFSDGWWKFGFDDRKNADVHDNNASWENGGYERDHILGENNMNEEWFGICAKGPTNSRGLYDLYPRAAYYGLKEAHKLNPYEEGVTLQTIDDHFGSIEIMDGVLKARGDKAALNSEITSKVRVSTLRAEFTTFNTGGDLITTPDEVDPDAPPIFPDRLGFDHMESYYVGVEGNTDGFRANIDFNVLGNVATNPIDQIFYENRGRPLAVQTEEGVVTRSDVERVAVYQAEVDWNHKWFNLKGFYRTGHYHWGYEGDFFGLYPEANYGPNIDIYNGEAPFGMEFEGKRELDGLKIAYGPELWWGANPAVLIKYGGKIGHVDLTGIYHEDIDDARPTVSSIAIPQPKTRRLTLHAKTKVGKVGIELGGIWGGEPLVGRSYQFIDGGEPGNYNLFEDVISNKDTWGGKAKITYSSGKFNWYVQGAGQGLVAFGGADQTLTFTGWKLKDSGSGNQYNFLTGFTYLFGNLQVAPNFLWQKPIVGPIPSDVQDPGRPRNIIDDPFAVRRNRETTGGEILLTWDPTPGSWFYEWDNDRSEDAKFAMNLGFVYRHLPTTQDAAIGILPDGRTTFAFPGAPPAEDLWEVHARMVSKLTPDFGFIINWYTAKDQARGSDDRLIRRHGTDLRLIYKKVKLISQVKVDDWGPYDYHRDFNLTFPVQYMVDLSTTLGKPDWFILPSTRLGIRYTWRSLDQFSPRYEPDVPDAGQGNEWEIRTYVHINIGK